MSEKITEMEKIRLKLDEDCLVCRQPIKACLCEMIHTVGD